MSSSVMNFFAKYKMSEIFLVSHNDPVLIVHQVFECLLQLRADSLGRLGLPDEHGVMKYSPYILCDAG